MQFGYRRLKNCIRLFISQLDMNQLDFSHAFKVCDAMRPTSKGDGMEFEFVNLSFDDRHIFNSSGFSAGMEPRLVEVHLSDEFKNVECCSIYCFDNFHTFWRVVVGIVCTHI